MVKRNISLEDIIPEKVYFLNDINPRMKYEDGKRTKEVAGYVYLATNTDSFDQIQVFVEQSKPLFASEELEKMQSSGRKIFIEFVDARIKLYYSERTRSIEDSIKAQNVLQIDGL